MHSLKILKAINESIATEAANPKNKEYNDTILSEIWADINSPLRYEDNGIYYVDNYGKSLNIGGQSIYFNVDIKSTFSGTSKQYTLTSKTTSVIISVGYTDERLKNANISNFMVNLSATVEVEAHDNYEYRKTIYHWNEATGNPHEIDYFNLLTSGRQTPFYFENPRNYSDISTDRDIYLKEKMREKYDKMKELSQTEKQIKRRINKRSNTAAVKLAKAYYVSYKTKINNATKLAYIRGEKLKLLKKYTTDMIVGEVPYHPEPIILSIATADDLLAIAIPRQTYDPGVPTPVEPDIGMLVIFNVSQFFDKPMFITSLMEPNIHWPSELSQVHAPQIGTRAETINILNDFKQVNRISQYTLTKIAHWLRSHESSTAAIDMTKLSDQKE